MLASSSGGADAIGVCSLNLLGGVSTKVASSALETHGRIDQLMAGESGRPCGEILSASDLATVRAAFVRVLGEEVVRQFEAAGEEAGEGAGCACAPRPTMPAGLA